MTTTTEITTPHPYLPALSGAIVMASIPGHTIAELRVKGERFVMTRRDANDELSTHSLLIDATDGARLAAHWAGFCEVAVRDHKRRAPATGWTIGTA